MSKPRPELIELAARRDVTAVSLWLGACRRLDGGDVGRMYAELRAAAPRRHSRGRRYFVGHDGRPGSGDFTNRHEEHLALAMFNDQKRLVASATRAVDIIDYQVPLKATRSDAGIGKLDLFGIDQDDTAAVIELKVASGSRAETPLRALLEGTAYAAIVETNLAAFNSEVSGLVGRRIAGERPSVWLFAPSDYWSRWMPNQALPSDFVDLLSRLVDTLGIAIHLLDLGGPIVTPGLRGERPALTATCEPRIIDWR